MEKIPNISIGLAMQDKKVLDKVQIDKEIFKTNLRKLFENGKTPKDITDTDYAKALGINIENYPDIKKLKAKIITELTRLFTNIAGKKSTLDFQYERYLNDQSK